MSRRLMYVLTIPQSALGYLRGQLHNMQARGYEVVFVAADTGNGQLQEVAQREGVRVRPLSVEREIDPLGDLRSIWQMFALLRQERPDIINFGNPKTGLVGGIASWLSGTPVRIYTLHGLRLETTRGLKRLALYAAERVTIACAHQVVAVSSSLRDEALALRLAPPEKIRVLRTGSVNGVPPLEIDSSSVSAERERLQLGQDGVVLGFVGRFTRDKGMRELLEAFQLIQRTSPDVKLLLVGDFEEGDPVDPETQEAIRVTPNVYRTGYVQDVTPYYALMDMLILPTYREGMSTVALEAASMGLPVISTKATGARDAVQHARTGLLVPVGDVQALTQAMQTLVNSPELRRTYGAAGREWMRTAFRQEDVWNAWNALYEELLQNAPDRQRRRYNRAALVGALVILAGATRWTTRRKRR